MEVLHTPPTHDSFTPLSTHQSQTPESFFSGPPVLYHHSPSTTILLHKSDLNAAPALAVLAPGAQATTSTNGTARPALNGHSHEEEEQGPPEAEAEAEAEDEDEELEIAGIDIWITSERLTLFSPTLNTGLAIPYPSIALHALKPHPHPSLLLQLLTAAHTFDDYDPDATVSMTIVVPAAPAAAAEEMQRGSRSEDGSAMAVEGVEMGARALYGALSACANLHPDPVSGEEEEDGEEGPGVRFEGEEGLGEGGSGGGLPPPVVGGGGWITAENVGEYFDEEGNWRGSGRGLGAGAGSVRGREEGGEGDEEETKWSRTG